METAFKNSSLMSTMKTTIEVEKFYYATESALSKQPNSKFWKDAFEFIEKRFKKIKNPKPKHKLGL
ncbi:hypothetical protein [Myroides sp.]|uniref:hypothetical protein n=1 Tax=Myroides sp. TaxID=1874736 RepID=UPI003F31447A